MYAKPSYLALPAMADRPTSSSHVQSGATEHVQSDATDYVQSGATEHVQGGATEHVQDCKSLALDGAYYDETEFTEYYGDVQGKVIWREAWNRGRQLEKRPVPQPVPPPGQPPPTVLQSTSPPLQDVHDRAETLPPASATTDPAPALNVSSTVAQIPILDPSELSGLTKRAPPVDALHREARDILSRFAAQTECHPVDVEKLWTTWKYYVATHKRSHDIVGIGVASVTIEGIPNTKDPNRGNRQRIDIFMRRVDGSAVRLHPGTTRKNDAEVRTVLKSTPSYLDASDLEKIPQTDRMNKKEAYDRLSSIEKKEKTVIDLTDESRFPWKLFLANVPAVLELLRDEKLHSVKLINQRPTRVTLELAVGGLPPRTHFLALIKDATRHDVKVVVA